MNRDKAGAAQAKAHLRALATAESAYFAVNRRFTAEIQVSDSSHATGWVLVADSKTLMAVATHPWTSGMCSMTLVADTTGVRASEPPHCTWHYN